MRRLIVLVVALLAGCTAPAADLTLSNANESAPPGTVPTTVANGDEIALAHDTAGDVAAKAPPVPTLSAAQARSPADGARRVDHRSVSFSWLPGSTSDDAPIAYEVLANGELVCQSRGTTCTSTLEPGVDYSWSIVAAAGALRAESDAGRFRTNAPPLTARPVSPALGSHSWIDGDPFELASLSDPDGDTLEVTIHVMDEFDDDLVDECALDDCDLDLEEGESYIWYATVSDGLLSAETPRMRFRTDAPPSEPFGFYPAEDSHYWMEGDEFEAIGGLDPDGDDVELHIEVRDDRDRAVGDCVVDEDCDEIELDIGEAYEYRVEARAGRLSTYSDWIPFRTNAPPLPVQIDAGDNGAEQLPLNPTWFQPEVEDPDGDRVHYDWITRDEDGEVVDVCMITSINECYMALPRYGATYETTIIATDEYGLTSSASFEFTTRLPVVFVHGWRGSSETWMDMAEAIANFGTETIVVEYVGNDDSIFDIARFQVQPAIERALQDRGYESDQRIDLVAHSMGGLVSRTLLEHSGRYGTGPSIAAWDQRVRTFTTVGTPHLGEDSSYICGGTDWSASCADMDPGSQFLDWLGTRPATGVEYRAIAGDKNGDDDGLVEIYSAAPYFIEETYVIPGACHSSLQNWNGACAEILTTSVSVYDLLVDFLGPRAG